MHFVPKSLQLITGSEKGEVGLFDLRMMKMVETFQAHESTVHCASFSRDGKFLFTGSKAGSLKVRGSILLRPVHAGVPAQRHVICRLGAGVGYMLVSSANAGGEGCPRAAHRGNGSLFSRW
jgi:hypothetical protein